MLEKLRLRLANVDALPQLALLGLVIGILSGALIIAFRMLIEISQASFLPAGQTENYEGLSVSARFLIPTLGGLAIGLIFQYLSPASRQVGVTHVMERLSYHQGHLPLRNAISQFIGAGVSIISGHSVGREGPSIHLGAASGSLLGQWTQLPNNSIRTLVACGVAAAIAASFNTPIAGVIFAMEVVLMEYTLAGFTPVILASVSGTALTRWVYGSSPAFSVPSFELASIFELPYVILIGLVIGTLAALFVTSLKFFTHWLADKTAVWQRLTLAGTLTGICAVFVPEIMGIGYDTVNAALVGQLGIGLMLGIVVFKMLATTAGLGLGLPGGLIGPTLVIGAAAGGTMGLVADMVFPGEVSHHAFYALIGMGAMMGATLQAPLSALMAMLELTANPNIILPGMLAVISSGMTTSEIFGRAPVYLALMRARGLDYFTDPVTQSLRRVGVASLMDSNFIVWPQHIKYADAQDIAAGKLSWIVVERDGQPVSLIATEDLSARLSSLPDSDLDLMAIDLPQRQIAPINFQATLHEARDILNSTASQALYIQRQNAPNGRRIFGVLTREALEQATPGIMTR